MNETRFEELKRYVRFDDDDARALRAFRPVAAPHFVRIAREFYERIREHEDAHAVFTGEEQIERLQRSLVRWMDRALSGTYDEAYFEETLKIGRVHVRVGLPQRYMFTAMALIRVALDSVAERNSPNTRGTRAALSRLLDLELAIMLEGYREDLAEQARRRSELGAQALRTDLAHALGAYDTAINTAPNLIVSLDREGKIRLFNRAAQATTGYALEDVFGASFVDTLVAESARAKVAALIESLLAGGASQVVEESLVRTRAGKVLEVRWHLQRVDDGVSPDDSVLFANGADVTGSRAASRQVQRNERLAALGTLAAGLAHEIRNPLNGAQLHLSFLQRALAKAKQAPELLEAVGVVSDEIQRLAGLVSEFLDFARPSALDKKRVVVQELVARTLELTAAHAAQVGITIDADEPPQDLVVHADGGKLQQALLNLVQNAIEALTPAATGHVVIRARRHPRYVLVEVEDDGPGLSSPEAPIFDAFFSTKPRGTGLGLAITHRIVTDHGGTVEVESRPGRTCFRVAIPIGTPSTEQPDD